MSIAAIDRRKLAARPGNIEPRPSRAAKEWRATLVRSDVTIHEAIEAIDKSALQIALIVDHAQRLIGTVTDGDVRRGLLRGISLAAAVTEIMNAQPRLAVRRLWP